MQSSSVIDSTRLAGIDTLRLFAILAVTAIHTIPFTQLQEMGGRSRAVAALLDVAFRFAVPYFFITSGYFYGKAVHAGRPPLSLWWRYSKPLLILFIAWSVIFAFIPQDWPFGIHEYGVKVFYWHFRATVGSILSNPLPLLLTGTMPHLWFLPALVIALGVITFLVILRASVYILPLAVSLAFGLTIYGLARYYVLPKPILPLLGSLLFALLFVCLGWQLSSLRSCSYLLGAGLLTAGFGLLVGIGVGMFDFLNTGIVESSLFIIGEIPFALGVFLLALAYPRLGASTFLPFVGRLTPGIYVSHVLFALPARAWVPCPACLFSFFVVFGLSAVFTVFLSSSVMTRFLVMTRR